MDGSQRQITRAVERIQRVGLRTRLVLLILIPVLLVAVVAGVTATERRDRARLASDVRDGVADLAGLVDVRTSLLFARAAAEVEFRAGSVGLGPQEAASLLELDLDDDGLTEVEAALRSLAPGERPFDLNELAELEEALATGSDQAVLDRFSELETTIDRTWEDELIRLDQLVVDLGDIVLARSLEDLEQSSVAGTATSTLLTDLADYWFSLLDGSDRAESARNRLAAESARFDQAIGRLGASDDPEVVGAASALGSARSSGPFGAAIDDGVAGRPAAPFVAGVDLALVVETFSDSFQQLQPSLDLVTGRSALVERQAASLADDSSRTASVTLAVGSAAVLLMVVLSIVVAASFERPLRRFIATARRVGGGDLDVDPLPVDGPGEVAAASSALNDVTETLRLLRDKVEALADDDLADPRLRVALPGEVGEVMDASVGELAESVADRARRGRAAETLAIENARRYDEQRADSLLLQHSLLPGQLPDIEGLEVAVRYQAGADGTEVGGDWYEVLALPDKVVVVMGDVSGRGLEAAAVMATVRFTLRTLAAQGFNPARILDETNAILGLGGALGHFATSVCAVIDRAERTVAVADAGHPRPLLVAGGSASWIQAPIGPPLAAWPSATYEERTVVMGSATLLLVTDGLFERRGETIDVGLERLRETAAATLTGPLDAGVDALLDALTGGAPGDDTAILALRWTD